MFNLLKNTYQLIQTKTTKINLAIHGILALLAFAGMRFANIILDNSYADSKFPVPYYVGQTTFDGGQLKEYYSFMQNADTLNIYWQTQFIDFAFIGMVIITGLLFPSFVARLHQPDSFLQKATFALALIMPFGGIMDSLENLVSFVMLAQPATFANWLAIPYSSFAMIKFAAIGTAQIGTALSLIIALVLIIWRRLSQRSTVALI